MEKKTIKIAELATIFYAFLVCMGLLIDNAYFSQFNIRIVSYMSAAEILLSSTEGLLSMKFTGMGGMILSAIVGFAVSFGITWLHGLSFFSKPNSLTAKFSVAAKYNTIIVALLVLSVIVGAFVHIKWSIDIFIWFCTLQLIVLYFRFPNPFASIWKSDPPYDWSAHPIRELFFNKDKIRKRMAPNFSFGPKSTRMIRLNYDYRIMALVLAIIVSIFFIQVRLQLRKADEVKKNGAGVCVILKGDGIDVDTREGTIDYIGECASHIFLYDRETQGTIIYARTDISHYLLITDYIARAHFKYDRYADQLQTGTRHVGASLLQIINDAPKLTNDFELTIPDNFVLIQQQNNYLVWEDTVSKAYIEQLSLPEELFDDMPEAKDIFDLDIYIPKTYNRENPFYCVSDEYGYSGKGGEWVKAAVAKTDHYTAWLYYDPDGTHQQEGEDMIDSMRLTGSVWHQIALIFQTHKIGWIIIFLILSIGPLACFKDGLNHKKKEEETTQQEQDQQEDQQEVQQEDQQEQPQEPAKKSRILAVIKKVIYYLFFVTILFVLFMGHNRWPVILTILGLYIASVILMYIIGRIINSVQSKKD